MAGVLRGNLVWGKEGSNGKGARVSVVFEELEIWV